MKKKKIIILCLIIIFTFSLFCKNGDVYAESSDLKTMGVYLKSIPVNKTIKVYVQENLKGYLEENGIPVYSEKRGGWWFIKDYYYIADKYVEKIVESRMITNDVDSLRFMVNELEDEAKKINSNEYKNIALGYIRSINPEYVTGYYGSWSTISGSLDEEAINKINNQEKQKIGLRFNEYFAQFMSFTNSTGEYNESQYNKNLHGEVREQFRNKEERPIRLIDPASKTKCIDVIHMFASIDGIYCKTQKISYFKVGNNRMERDIVSWNGDLQQAAKNIYTLTLGENAKLSSDDFKKECNQKMKLIFSDNYECSEDDILADIDAMNLTKLFVDHDNTTIAAALSGYYELIYNNEQKRFKTFIKTILIDEEKMSSIKNKTEIERFESEVANQFNISIQKKDDVNVYSQNDFNDEELFVGFKLMRKNGKIPDTDVRIFVVKSFIEYVEEYL